jgi:LacI family transcriptional regulator
MPTMKDVARKADVSIKTVSRVVNNEVGVSEETQKLVRQAIHELGYVPNLSAQRLKRGRSNLLALLLPRVESPYAVKLLSSILLETESRGYYTLVLKGNLDSKYDREYIQRAIVNNQIDGLLIAPPGETSTELIDFIEENHVPYVAITPNSSDRSQMSVEATDREGALEATRYLVSMGHRRIAHITCLECERFSQERREGYEEALSEAGLPIDTNLVVYGDNSTKSGYINTLKLLNLAEPPTAIFAGNDEMAVGTIIAMWHQGLRLPDDISVIGFDDAPIVLQAFPYLTTVNQPIEQIAKTSVDMLTNFVEGRGMDLTRLQVPTRLIIRHSCTVPRQGPLVKEYTPLSPIDIQF